MLDSKLVSFAEHNTIKVQEDTQHEEALNVVLKEVAECLWEKQNASKRAAANAGTEWTIIRPQPDHNHASRWTMHGLKLCLNPCKIG